MEPCKIKHAVYRYVLDGQELYIGKTDRGLIRRLSQHGVPGDNITCKAWNEINKADIYFVETINSTMTDVLESEMIRRHKPKYNKAKTSEWAGLPLEEPEWKQLDKTLLETPIPQNPDALKIVKGFDHNKYHNDIQRNTSACEKALEILGMVVSTRPSVDEYGQVTINLGVYEGNIIDETMILWHLPHYYAHCSLISQFTTDNTTGEVLLTLNPWKLYDLINDSLKLIEKYKKLMEAS